MGVMSHFFKQLCHLQLVVETLRWCHQSEHVFTAFLLCLNIFKKSPLLSNLSQNLVWVQINFCSHSHTFLFWCTLFHLHSVSRQGHTTHILWKFLHKPVKNCIFKTSIKYVVYVVNCKSYYLTGLVTCISQEKLKWESLCLHSEVKEPLMYVLQS